MSNLVNFKDIETNSLRNRTALANRYYIAFLDTETRADMGSHVGVTLFITFVLGNILKVIAANDDRTLHLVFEYYATKDTTTDSNSSSEWALEINICTILSFLWCFKTETDLTHKTLRILFVMRQLSLSMEVLFLNNLHPKEKI